MRPDLLLGLSYDAKLCYVFGSPRHAPHYIRSDSC